MNDYKSEIAEGEEMLKVVINTGKKLSSDDAAKLEIQVGASLFVNCFLTIKFFNEFAFIELEGGMDGICDVIERSCRSARVNVEKSDVTQSGIVTVHRMVERHGMLHRSTGEGG